MRRYFELVRSYQLDHFCTPVSWGRIRRFFCHWLPSFWLAATELYGTLWYRANGQPRRFKPANFDNPVSSMLNRSLMGTPRGPRKLKLWERVLLALGF